MKHLYTPDEIDAHKIKLETSLAKKFSKNPLLLQFSQCYLNSLSARLGVSGYDRTYHGALLDAQILADTYLHLTGGQITFDLSASQSNEAKEQVINQSDKIHFTNFKANENDISEHNKFLDVLRKKSNKEINW